MQRLAHQAEQDAWFTGNPQHSFFITKEVTRDRYVQKSFEVPFNGPTAFSGSAIANIPMYGDRITDITLKMVLPQLEYPVAPNGWVYPQTGITPPKIYTFFSNQTYGEIDVNATVQYLSLIHI